MNATIQDLHWQSDWNGDEVGFDDIAVVGLYSSTTLGYSFYLNTENGAVLAIIPDEDED